VLVTCGRFYTPNSPSFAGQIDKTSIRHLFSVPRGLGRSARRDQWCLWHSQSARGRRAVATTCAAVVVIATGLCKWIRRRIYCGILRRWRQTGTTFAGWRADMALQFALGLHGTMPVRRETLELSRLFEAKGLWNGDEPQLAQLWGHSSSGVDATDCP